jgi:hypothetical protein
MWNNVWLYDEYKLDVKSVWQASTDWKTMDQLHLQKYDIFHRFFLIKKYNLGVLSKWRGHVQ